ncbi:MAG: DNA-formamidopyrimidine glycosylase family protein [Acidimicrobiales bacterium]
MPELPEVEAYRGLAEAALHRLILSVEAPDAWFLKRCDVTTLDAILTSSSLLAARRRGKLLLLDTAAGVVLGLRFGMTGRLVVDGQVGVDDLLYTSNEARPEWERFGVTFADGGRMSVIDPRRLGGVELDPDEDRLGPDARSIRPAALRAVLGASTTALKARLLDQSRLAGVGNLIADEALWRASLDPRRQAGSLTPAEFRRLHRHLTNTIEDLIARGGSHQGDFLPHRHPGGTCPRDGSALLRAAVGGRTTWMCPVHQG